MKISDNDAEIKILSVVIKKDPRSFKLLRVCKLSDFFVKENRWLFKNILYLFQETGDITSSDVLLHKLKDDGAGEGVVEIYRSILEKMENGNFITDGDLDYYYKNLKAASKGRRVRKLLQGSKNNGKAIPGIISLLRESKIEQVEDMIRDFSLNVDIDYTKSEGEYLDQWENRRNKLQEMIDNPEEFLGLKVGIEHIDRSTGGVMKGELCLFVADTGVGKTTLLLNSAVTQWEENHNVIYFTVEMTKEQIEFKVDSKLTGINSDKFRRAYEGLLSQEEKEIWEKCMEERNGKNNRGIFYIVDMDDFCTVNDVESKCLEVERKFGIEFDSVFVDYIGLMSDPNHKGGRLDWDAMASVAMGLKFFSKRREKRVFTAAQMISKVGKNKREKGTIGEVVGLSYLIPQASDLAIVANRDIDLQGIIDIRIGKHRFGNMGRVKYNIDYGTCTICERKEITMIDSLEEDDE